MKHVLPRGLGQDSPVPSDPSGSRCSRWAAQLKTEWPGEKKSVHQVWWNVEIPQGDLSLTVVLDAYYIFMLIDGYIDAYWWLHWWLLMIIDGYWPIDDDWWLFMDILIGYGCLFMVILDDDIDGYWFSIGMVQVERTQASSKEPHCRNRDLSSFEVQAGWGGCGGLFNTWKNMQCFSLYIYCVYLYIININVTHTHTHI